MALETLYLCKIIKEKLQRVLQEIMKIMILQTSDAWSMSRCASDPAYYIEDCWNSRPLSMISTFQPLFKKKLSIYGI